MAYSKQNFQDGQILTAANLEKMENGIIAGQGVRNLLVNSNFKNPINSNGKSSYSSTVETIDKWIGNSTTTSVSIIENQGIMFTSNSSYNLLKQDFPQGSLAGKVLTLVVWDSTNTVFLGSGIYPSAGSATTVYYDSVIHLSFDARYGTDAVRIGTIPNATSNITIKYVALYEGAYTKDTLQNYIPKSNSTELFDCGLSSQPYNLIINGNFRKSAFIASDGLNATAYLGNNWLGHSSITVEQNNLNIKLTSSTQYAYIFQKVAVEVGKAYTFVVKTPSISSSARIAIYNSDLSTIFSTKVAPSSDKIIITTAVPTSSPISCLFYPGFTEDGGNSTIEYAALYEGAYSLDTLPTYTPYPKQIEMMRCGVAVQPENLLNNSDFTNVINTKGLSSYEGQVEGIDGWVGRVVAQKVEVESTDVKITATGTAYAAIKQKVAKIPKLVGKTITFAAKLYSNVDADIRIADAGENMLAYSISPAGKTNILIVNYTVPSGATEDSVVPTIMLRTQASGNYIRLYWAALYEGAYDASTLPPYVPKGKHVEMLNCNVPLTPYNLLDNSDFRNPVNQRGQTSYSGNVYTIDMWRLNANTLNVGSNGITLAAGDSSSAVLTQYTSGLRDGVYTQALNVNGTIYTRMIQLSGSTITTLDASNAAYTGGYVSCAVSSSGYFSFQIRANAGYSITVRWAALYEGSYDASTLPAYQPKGYAAELAECQRYFIRVGNSAAYGIISGTGCVVKVPLPMTMRKDIVPTVTLDSAAWAYTHEGYVGLTFIETTYSTNTASLHFTLGTETSARCCVVPDLSFNISADL